MLKELKLLAEDSGVERCSEDAAAALEEWLVHGTIPADYLKQTLGRSYSNAMDASCGVGMTPVGWRNDAVFPR